MDEFDIRIKSFQWLNQQKVFNENIFHRTDLEKGFIYHDRRITLMGAQGIWFPKDFEMPISITTTIGSPYLDSEKKEGSLEYKYRGTDPDHRDNSGLRKAMKNQTPLIYFKAVNKGLYYPIFPVFIINDDPSNLSFDVAIDPAFMLEGNVISDPDVSTNPVLRRYVRIFVQQRLHQNYFRDIVLTAYNNTCSMCNLQHPELLDAAHIIPDSDPEGEPIINNGISLCKIHHAAYDQNILGINPDYLIKIRTDILEEKDGPMLKYGLQYLNDKNLILPVKKKDYPDRARLEKRFELFKSA